MLIDSKIKTRPEYWTGFFYALNVVHNKKARRYIDGLEKNS